MRSAAAAALAALTTTALPAQQPTFRSEVALVRLDVSVTRAGRPVPDLSASDFEIADNGVPQTINSVTRVDGLPLSVMLVLDLSGSITGRPLSALLDAGRGLLDALREGDAAGLVTFADAPHVVVAATRDRRAVRDALAGVKPGGRTALRDGIWTALQNTPVDDSRPLVLVFTDGIDNASWTVPSVLLQAAERAGVVIDAVTLNGGTLPPTRSFPPIRGAPLPPMAATPAGMLSMVTERSGGRQWSANASSQLRSLFTTALDEMRARYLVTFYPSRSDGPGWHEVKVLVKARGEVSAPRGYFVPK